MTIQVNTTGHYGTPHAKWLIKGESGTFVDWYEASVVKAGLASYSTPDEVVEDVADTLINATASAIEFSAESGLDLSQIIGTGKDGKVTLKDVKDASDS